MSAATSKVKTGLTKESVKEDEQYTPDRELAKRLEEANVEPYLRECVQIDRLDISEAMTRIPGELAYWNNRYADALDRFLTAEADLKLLKAQLQPLTRKAILEAGGKPTEEMVKSAVESNDQVVEAQREAIAAEVEKNRLYGMLDAVRSKKEMVISLGAHLRAEMGGDPLLRETVRGANRRNEG